MADKILCFSLSGYSLGVEQDQVEKILINKHPEKESFVLETGVEVKSLKYYIPLPEKEAAPAGNIFFLKDQKDFYGFTVDKILGYLTLTGVERIRPKRVQSPVKYFVKNDSRLIPVLDLQYITNNVSSVNEEELAEIASLSYGGGGPRSDEPPLPENPEDVSKDEIFRAIDEEIHKRKSSGSWEEAVQSEKKGVVLPLVVNAVIVVLVAIGIVFYFVANRRDVSEEAGEGSIGGVEEAVIEAIRRKSEEEIAAERERLKEAQLKLDQLEQERDSFVKNQDQLLNQRVRELDEEFQRRLEEARKRIAQSGVSNVDEVYAKEKERLTREFLESRNRVRGEIDEVKKQYDRALQQREEELKKDMSAVTRRIDEMNQKLSEEAAKVKAAEEAARSVASQQQEYLAFRRQLNALYNRALVLFGQDDYPRGIEELKKIPPIIENARARNVADEATLRVENDLVKNLRYLAEREQGRGRLEEIGLKTYESALALEREGKLQEALSRYFTVYTLVGDQGLREKSGARAQSIMDSLFKERTARENRELEQKASGLFAGALESKRRGELEQALEKLEEIILRYPAPALSKKVLDEIVLLNGLKNQQAGGRDRAGINARALEAMNRAKASYDSGSYSEAIAGYEEVVTKYRESDYTDDALAQIMRINEEMRKFKFSPSFTLKTGEVKTGVLVQLLPENSILISMGAEEGVKQGDILQLFRKETTGGAAYIGSVKVFEVNPKSSKCRIVYFERALKVGDIVSY
jgi:hypothetical protein